MTITVLKNRNQWDDVSPFSSLTILWGLFFLQIHVLKLQPGLCGLKPRSCFKLWAVIVAQNECREVRNRLMSVWGVTRMARGPDRGAGSKVVVVVVEEEEEAEEEQEEEGKGILGMD